MDITYRPISVDEVSTLDIRAEIERGTAEDVECYALTYSGGQRGDCAIWPSAGRAAVCLGGDSEWVDADTVDDALAAVCWAEDEDEDEDD